MEILGSVDFRRELVTFSMNDGLLSYLDVGTILKGKNTFFNFSFVAHDGMGFQEKWWK